MPLTRLDLDDALNQGRVLAKQMVTEARRSFNKPYTEALRKVMWDRFLQAFGQSFPHLAGWSSGDVEKYLRAADNATVEKVKQVFDNLEVDDGSTS